jgi:hypothetical protein
MSHKETAPTHRTSRKHALKVRVREFQIPPIHDALVLGRASHIGCAAIRKALGLLSESPYEHIEVDDDLVSDIIIRRSILRRLSQEALVAFTLGHVKPLMTAEEILHLDLEVEVRLETEES